MTDLMHKPFPGLGRNQHASWRAALRRKHAQLVPRDPRSYWEQKSWLWNDNQFEGWFRTLYGSYKGRAERTPSGVIEIYIANPPAFIDYSPHRGCIHHRGGGWHYIHVTNGLRDLSSGIIMIEHLLVEAFLLSRKAGKVGASS